MCVSCSYYKVSSRLGCNSSHLFQSLSHRLRIGKKEHTQDPGPRTQNLEPRTKDPGPGNDNPLITQNWAKLAIWKASHRQSSGIGAPLKVLRCGGLVYFTVCLHFLLAFLNNNKPTTLKIFPPAFPFLLPTYFILLFFAIQQPHPLTPN